MRSGFTFSMIVSIVFCAPVLAYDWSTNPGDGSPENPYRISEPNQLNAIGTDTTLLTKCYVLVNDIDLSAYQGDSFNIIGYFSESYISANHKPFSGIFDGNGYSISNFTYEYNPASKDYGIGLFAYVHGENALLKNLILNEPNVICNDNVENIACLVGALSEAGTGNNKGVIENCHIQNGHVTGRQYVGLLVGVNGGSVVNCSARGGACLGNAIAGSLVGMNSHIIERCYAEGVVEGGFYIGGFAGVNKEYIENCYFLGSVSGENTVGGFAGEFPGGNIRNCYSASLVSGTNIHTTGAFIGGGILPSYCFWNMSLCSLQGIGNILPPYTGLEGKTTSEMQTQSTLTSWDFVGESANGENEIWRMCTDGVDYPRLSWEFAQNGDFACGDGVDILDLLTLTEHWLLTETANPTTFNYACDANGDEKIDFLDYAVLGENW